jgi:hypothetical protein
MATSLPVPRLASLLLALAVVPACGDDGPPADDCEGGECDADECDAVEVRPIEEGIADGEACRTWLELTRGRVGAQSLIGSFAVVSRRTRDGLGLAVSAAHTQGTGAFGAEGTDVEASLAAPADEGTLSFKVPPADGALRVDELSPHYVLGHDAIPAAENNPSLTAIHPRHDYFLTIVDRQRLTFDGGAFPTPGPREDERTPLFDPGELTTDDAPWAAATTGERAILIGFPQAGPETGAFSVGEILDDAGAEAALAALADAGDEEGDLAYDPEVEFLVATRAIGGMSGGGVFDGEGRFLGTMVRGSTSETAPPIVRVVRFTYVAARAQAILAAMAPAARDALAPFLDEELVSET